MKINSIKTKLTGAFSLIIAAIYVASEIPLPLPGSEQGEMIVVGRLLDCDIGTFGKGEGIVRFNLLQEDRSIKRFKQTVTSRKKLQMFYPDFCKRKPYLTVWYHAERTLLNPQITYRITKVLE